MLLGLNDHLERVMDCYRKGDSDTNKVDVMYMIANSLAADDHWHVPVDMMPEGSNETDYEEGCVLEKLPDFVKKSIRTSKGKSFFCAFTSPEKVCTDGAESLITIRYPARALLTEFIEADSCDGFIINPWTDDFEISKMDVHKLLDIAESVSEADIQKLRRYYLEPKAVLDIDAILDSWKEGWTDGESPQENWEYVCCPIMADGRVLILFELQDTIYDGTLEKKATPRSSSHYRVLEFQMSEDGLKQIGKYRFSAQDSVVSTVFLYDGELKASIRLRGSRKETILPMIPTNDGGQFTIYSNVRRIVTRSNGEVIVGYCANMLDDARLPLMVFDSEGEVVSRYKDEDALFCSDVNLDVNENIWIHMHPSATIDRLIPNTDIIESHHVALQGFTSFALSDDHTKLFLGFDEYGCGSVCYILSRDQSGNYIDPVRFDFSPIDVDGNKSDRNKSKSTYCPCSTMKSWVIIRVDNCLNLYDINGL